MSATIVVRELVFREVAMRHVGQVLRVKDGLVWGTWEEGALGRGIPVAFASPGGVLRSHGSSGLLPIVVAMIHCSSGSAFCFRGTHEEAPCSPHDATHGFPCLAEGDLILAKVFGG